MHFRGTLWYTSIPTHLVLSKAAPAMDIGHAVSLGQNGCLLLWASTGCQSKCIDAYKRQHTKVTTRYTTTTLHTFHCSQVPLQKAASQHIDHASSKHMTEVQRAYQLIVVSVHRVPVNSYRSSVTRARWGIAVRLLYARTLKGKSSTAECFRFRP